MQSLSLIMLIVAVPFGVAKAAEESLGPWDMSRVVWYRSHPSETTGRLKWCAEHNRGDSECGAAMQACNDILEMDPQATCQSPMAH
jgi:hypothetical protein